MNTLLMHTLHYYSAWAELDPNDLTAASISLPTSTIVN
jgi:hypothetical protein